MEAQLSLCFYMDEADSVFDTYMFRPATTIKPLAGDPVVSMKRSAGDTSLLAFMWAESEPVPGRRIYLHKPKIN